MSDYIPGGFYIKARRVQQSEISKKPPHIRETWDYLLREANHKDKKYGPFTVKRGQLFRTYKNIRDALSWNVGYRKESYNENHMKKAMKFLREACMITTQKEPGGVLITILNYDKYQNPKNYEKTNESPSDRTIAEPMRNHGVPTNNKNVQEWENEENVNSENSTQDQERESQPYPSSVSPPPLPEFSILQEQLFKLIWDAYPKQINEADARWAFAELKPNQNQVANTIIPSIQEHRQYAWDDFKYIPFLSTFLTKRKYENSFEVNGELGAVKPKTMRDVRIFANDQMAGMVLAEREKENEQTANNGEATHYEDSPN